MLQKIIKYSGKSCIRCKMLDKILKHMGLEDKTETIYVEDIGESEFIKMGVTTLPSLVLQGDGNPKEIKLFGNILPQDITDAINSL